MKSYSSPLTWSIGLCILVTPLGGYGGHHLKFSVVAILYCLATYYWLNRLPTRPERVQAGIALLLPVLIGHLPSLIRDLERTSISAPSTAAFFIGVLAGSLMYRAGKTLRIGLFSCLLAGSLWMTFFGYEIWLHKAYFGTFDGLVAEKAPSFAFETEEGKVLTPADFRDQVVVLDFWTTNCGVCFTKFPQFQAYHRQFRNATNVKFFAVNVPLKRDTLGQARAMLRSRDLDFPVLFARGDSLARRFGVSGYPTVIVLNKGNQLVYRGKLEDIDRVIATCL